VLLRVFVPIAIGTKTPRKTPREDYENTSHSKSGVVIPDSGYYLKLKI